MSVTQQRSSCAEHAFLAPFPLPAYGAPGAVATAFHVRSMVTESGH